MYLESYNKDNIDKDGKIIVPIIEEMLKLLIDIKSRSKAWAILKSTVQAFKTFHEKSKKLKKK